MQLILTEGSVTQQQIRSLIKEPKLDSISFAVINSGKYVNAKPTYYHDSWSSFPRFASDPDRVGAEKLSMTSVPKAYLEAEYKELPAAIGCA